MGIGNRRIVEVTADNTLIGIDLFDFFGNRSRLTGTYPECRSQLLFDGTSQTIERFGIQILDKCGIMAPVSIVSLKDSKWLLIKVNFFPLISSS